MPSKLARGLNKVLAAGGSEKAMDKEMVNFFMEKFDAARTIRRIFEIKWYITRAFLKGEQYVFWNTGTSSLDRHRAVDPRRVRIVDNKILTYVRKQQSKILRLRPVAEVLPNSNDLADVDAAKIGTDLLKHMHRTLHGPRLSREIANWMTSCGNAFVVDHWDSSLPGGGDVGLEVDSPFSWYLPALSHGPTEFNDLPWAIRAKLRSVNWIKETFDYDAQPESFTADQHILLLMKDSDQTTTGLEHVHMPSAVIKEIWIKPYKKFPHNQERKLS
jgi:hypothetical protein